jgi:putative phosphoribosyl transferase
MNEGFHKEVSIAVGNVSLQGELIIPPTANAIVIFSHGSGSSRFSKRNRAVAAYLQKRQMGTLLFDLLTEEEDQTYSNRFNIDLLSKRLAGATEWLAALPAAKECRIGYFGASTGAASALQAAAQQREVAAVVSRGGRPDLAGKVALQQVKAPSLLIVGSLDTDVLELNRQAFDVMHCIKELKIVPGASHLFEEEGMMDKVSALAAEWFEKYLMAVKV